MSEPTQSGLIAAVREIGLPSVIALLFGLWLFQSQKWGEGREQNLRVLMAEQSEQSNAMATKMAEVINGNTKSHTELTHAVKNIEDAVESNTSALRALEMQLHSEGK